MYRAYHIYTLQYPKTCWRNIVFYHFLFAVVLHNLSLEKDLKQKQNRYRKTKT